MSTQNKSSQKVEFFENRRKFSSEINLRADVFYSPQLCMAVWWSESLLCFSFFLEVPLNLLIFTVVPSTETQ
jgi:hypothetical protein